MCSAVDFDFRCVIEDTARRYVCLERAGVIQIDFELDGVEIVAFDIKLNGEDKSTALINIEADLGKKQIIFNRIV